MCVLLDEYLPRRFQHAFVGHEVRTVPEMGWASKKNGARSSGDLSSVGQRPRAPPREGVIRALVGGRFVEERRA